jgi:hypothetical protein
MKKVYRTLTATTPVGTFNRATASAYSHVNVWASPRAAAQAAEPDAYTGGVMGRWIKDHGYGVTWHFNEASARKAAAGKYGWDHSAKLVGIFPVDTLA